MSVRPDQVGTKSTLSAWLELMRISNLPTVWSNVLVGVALATVFSEKPDSGSEAGVAFLMAGAICSLVYVAGMAMNDLFDARLDARERPARPIPSGRISRRSAGVFVGVLLGAAGSLLLVAGPGVAVLGAMLILCVIAYNALHAKHAASAILMGLCRLLVIAIGAFAAGVGPGTTDALLWPCVALAAYISALTLLARREVGSPGRMRTRAMLAWLCVAIPIVGGLGLAIDRSLDAASPAALATGALLAAWLGRSARATIATPPRTIHAVLGLLSGICLIDAWLLALLGEVRLAGMALGLFALTVLAHRRILGA